jgi:hypothetical protein
MSCSHVYLAQSLRSLNAFSFFEIQRINGEDVLHVKRAKRESDGGVSPVTDESGFLVGVWERISRVTSSVVDKIEITFNNNKELVMLVLGHNHSLTMLPKHM